MVYKRGELRTLIRAFVNSLKSKKIRIQKIILFGSYAWGKPHTFSDIDLAVVSPDFKRLNEDRRIRLLLDVVYHLKMPKLVDIEALGFTSEELDNADYFDIAAEIRERGRVVYRGTKGAH